MRHAVWVAKRPSNVPTTDAEVIGWLNPENGTDFVSVCIEYTLVFIDTGRNLERVIEHLNEAGLLLNQVKCHFVKREVENIGYIIITIGLFPPNRDLLAVKNFPVPGGAMEVQQFIGLASYYHRFAPGFSKIAESVYVLTKKNAIVEWTSECQSAFMMLKSKLTEAPVLAFLIFSKGFVLETDASINGVGGVLSQKQEDGHLHSIAYASRSLSRSEKRYAITELDTLAVMWALSDFHAYLYGNDVTVYIH